MRSVSCASQPWRPPKAAPLSAPGDVVAKILVPGGSHFACCRFAACSSFVRLFLVTIDAPPNCVSRIEPPPHHHRQIYARIIQHEASHRRALTGNSFYAIVRRSGETSGYLLSLDRRYPHETRSKYPNIINMHQGHLDCKGADGTSRCVTHISESPGLVKPDIAGALKISPEPPPASSFCEAEAWPEPVRYHTGGHAYVSQQSGSLCALRRLIVSERMSSHSSQFGWYRESRSRPVGGEGFFLLLTL
jgi:hypothetical protein